MAPPTSLSAEDPSKYGHTNWGDTTPIETALQHRSEEASHRKAVDSIESVSRVRVTMLPSGSRFEHSFVRRDTKWPPPGVPGQIKLRRLRRRKRHSTSYEPHFRDLALKRLSTMFDLLDSSLGGPESAVRIAELRALLAETYKECIAIPAARNLSTAISMLQDFLRPHWSQLDRRKVREIAVVLKGLAGQGTVSERSVACFYGDLSTTLGGHLSIPVEVGDEGEAQAQE